MNPDSSTQTPRPDPGFAHLEDLPEDEEVYDYLDGVASSGFIDTDGAFDAWVKKHYDGKTKP